MLRNQQLFSSVYLREMQAARAPLDVFEASRRTIAEWREEYVDLARPSVLQSYVRQSLSALGVAYVTRSQGDGFTLFSDASKEHAVGLCLLVDDSDLGRATKGRHHQVRAIRELRAANLDWGIVTNGVRWRLCHAKSAAPYEEWLEADLDGLLEASELALFGVFQRCFGGTAWSASSAVKDGIGLDELLLDSHKRTEAVEKHLKSRVETILQRLCLGFVQGDAAHGGGTSRAELDEIYRNATYLLYRILFLFYAEARDLLPVEEELYARESLAQTVLLARQHQEGEVGADEFSLWKRLTRLFVVVDEGDGELGVSAYNGGLFSDEEKPYLKSHTISDSFLAPALFDLAFEETKTGPRAIDYRDLSVRHLGTLYEGLLEYKLNLVVGEPVVVRDLKGKRQYVPQSEAGAIKRTETILERGEVYFADDKGERKASGSYYTPEDVVQYIIGNTVRPKLEEARQSLDQELERVRREREVAANDDEKKRLERYADGRALAFIEEQVLRTRILDPAMGSGHFLVAAGQIASDFIVETLEATPWANEDISSEPQAWKRRVVERCLYGVDKNPLAQELAKLSLWIASASAGKPLTFLDHHLKIGNSLLGTPLRRLGTLPSAKKSKAAPVQQTADMFAVLRGETIAALLGEMAQITEADSDSIEDVKHKGEAHARAQARAQRWRDVANVWLASLFGLRGGNRDSQTLSESEWQEFLGDLSRNYAPEQWQARVSGSQILGDAGEIAEREGFLHWELEFPDSVQDGVCRFDCIIANPPYVGTRADAAIAALYQTAPCGDLYAWIFEKALQVLAPTGALGTIVPLSLMFSETFSSLRQVLLIGNVHLRLSSFDNVPDGLFNAGKTSSNTSKENMQRTSMVLAQKIESPSRIEATNLLRWWHEDRHHLFDSCSSLTSPSFAHLTFFPKLARRLWCLLGAHGLFR
jgi:hypothetical protein